MSLINPIRVYRFLKTIIIVGVISAIYGIHQTITGSGAYPLSFFGNQNFLAAYLVIACPLALFFGFGRKINIFWIISFLIITLCLLFTRTRGAYIGFSIGMVFFFVIAGIDFLKRKEMKVILGILILAFIVLSINPSTSPIKRILSTFRITDEGIAIQGTALERFYLWKAGIRTMLAYPLTGCGIETMRLAYARFEPKELEVVGGHNVKADRSHNETVDMGVTRGIPGLIVYVWLWGMILVLLFKIRKKDKILSASLAYSFIAYFVQNQFNFSMPSYTTTFWILLGLSSLLLSHVEKKKYLQLKAKVSPIRIIVFSIVAIFALVSFISTFPIYIADTYFKNAVLAKDSGQFDNAIKYSEEAIKRHPKEVYYYETLCESQFMKAQFARSKEEQKEWVNKTFSSASKALFITPTNGFFYNLTGGLYTLLYFSGEEEGKDLAMEEYRKALQLMPVFTEPYLNMAVIYKKEKELDKAIECYEKILEISPNYPEALVYLGDIYIEQGKMEDAFLCFENAVISSKEKINRDPANKKYPPILKYAESMVAKFKR